MKTTVRAIALILISTTACGDLEEYAVTTQAIAVACSTASNEELLVDYTDTFPELWAPAVVADPETDTAVAELHDAQHATSATVRSLFCGDEPTAVPADSVEGHGELDADALEAVAFETVAFEAMPLEPVIETAPMPHPAASGLIARHDKIKEDVAKLNGIIDARRAEVENALIQSLMIGLAHLYGVDVATIERIVQARVAELVKRDPYFATSERMRLALLGYLDEMAGKALEGARLDDKAIQLTGEDKDKELARLKTYRDSHRNIQRTISANVIWHMRNDVYELADLMAVLPKIEALIKNGTSITPEMFREMGINGVMYTLTPERWRLFLLLLERDLARLEEKLKKTLAIVEGKK